MIVSVAPITGQPRATALITTIIHIDTFSVMSFTRSIVEVRAAPEVTA